MARRTRFGRKEKLKSRKQIDELFASGKSFPVYPLRVTYRFVPSEGEQGMLQAGFTASKKNFKRAVDRNRIKRLIREAYRLQKAELIECVEQKRLNGYVFFMFTDRSLPSFSVISEAMGKCLGRMHKTAAIEKIP